MKCEICGLADPSPIIILPIKKAGGSLITLACKKCAGNSRAYCRKHAVTHLGFVDDTTACLRCIDQLLHDNLHRADSIYAQVLSVLPEDDQEELEYMAREGGILIGESCSVTTLRYVCTKALRSQKSIDEVLAQLAVARSIEYLIGRPSPFNL